jgi:hypothetical protein
LTPELPSDTIMTVIGDYPPKKREESKENTRDIINLKTKTSLNLFKSLSIIK